MAIFGKGKHSGNPEREPTTDQGKAWSKMSGEEKGKEFDASTKDPKGYAERNFPESKGGNRREGKGGKHAK